MRRIKEKEQHGSLLHGCGQNVIYTGTIKLKLLHNRSMQIAELYRITHKG